jgi:hypothetical protein
MRIVHSIKRLKAPRRICGSLHWLRAPSLAPLAILAFLAESAEASMAGIAAATTELSTSTVANWTSTVGFQTFGAALSFAAGVLTAKYIYRKVLGRWPIEDRKGCPEELSIRQPWRILGCRNRRIVIAAASLWVLTYVWLLASLFLPSFVLGLARALLSP